MRDQDSAFVLEENKCAYALANMTCDEGFSFNEHCSAQIHLLFLAYSIGISTLCFVKR